MIKKYFEIGVMRLAIYYLRKRWGADCEQEDTYWHEESGCQSCMARRCIRFLEKHEKYCREDD